MKPNLHPSRTCLAVSAAGLLALAGALTARADYSSTVQSYSPTAYWRLNETTPVPGDISINLGTVGAAGNGFNYGVQHPVAGIPGAGSDGAATILNNPANNGGMRRVRVPFTAGLAPSGPFTAEFWCKPITGGNPSGLGGTPLSFMDFSASRGWLFYQGASVAGNWTFRVYNGSAGISITTGTITAGQWHHVVGVYDGTKMSLYVDNVLLGQNTVTYAPVTNPSIPLSIGTRGDGASGWFGYSGDIDEVVLYTNVLSPTDIANHYNAGINPATPDYSVVVTTNNPVGYWRLNEAAPVLPVAANLGSTGSSAQGIYQPWMTNGVAGPGYAGLGGATVTGWNGQGGYINCGTNVSGLSTPLSSITVMTWAKFSPTRTMDWESIITCGDTAWELQRPNNDYGVDFRFAGTSISTPSSRPLNDGNWHHIAATYDGAQQKIYLDGTLAASGNKTGANLGESVYPILIGDNGQWPGRVFKGNLAEMAVFPSALAASDIQTIYNAAQVPPVITSQPQGPSSVYESDSVSLTVQAIGVPTLAYQWTKGGAPLSGKTTNSLALNNVAISDSGNYAVVITNPYGSVTSSIVALTVQASKPLIITQPASVMSFVGGPATFTVAARGSQPIAYQWNKGGSPIAGATTSSYTLASIQWTDAGSYSCTLNNSYGPTNTTTVTLTVGGEFAAMSLPDTGIRDRHTALGSDGAYLYFMRGITNSSFYRMPEGVSGSWATLSSIPLPTDPAAYSVTDNGVGDLAYYNGALYTLARNNSGDGTGARAVYKYDIAGGSWTTGTKFSGGDGPNAACAVIDESHILGAWIGTANIDQVTNWSSGYFAGLSTLAGGAVHPWDACMGTTNVYILKHYNAAATLGVLVSVNKTNTTAVTTINGLPFNPGMGCAIEYIPGSLFSDAHPRLYVLRGGTGTTDGDGRDWTTAATQNQLAVYDLTTSTWSLTTLPFAVGDGSEMCLVNKNLYILGANSETQPLKVLYLGPAVKPIVTTQPVAQTIYAGQSATFGVSLYGGGPYTYQWRCNGVAIPGATGATLTVANADYLNAANYDVVVVNAAGNVTCQPASLTVLPPPAFANLTNGLVVHLKLDGDYNDASGNGNFALGMGSPTFVPGKLGQAVELHTDHAAGIYNYLELDDANTPPQFEFGATDSFSIALWVKYTTGFYDLPILGNAKNSTYNDGYVLTEDNGQFAWTIQGVKGAGAVAGDPVGGPKLNDGAWHQLTLVLDRSQAVVQSYVDGALIDTRSSAGVGSLNTGNPVYMGQAISAATGNLDYATDGTFDLDDVGIWNRALTPLEAESIYMVGQKGLSYDTVAPITMAVRQNGGRVQVIWQAGTLQWADDVNGTWSNVPNATAPYYYYTPASGTAKKFFRVR